MTETTRIFPPLVEAKINDMGFFVVAIVPLTHLWSVVAIKEDRRYNIQLHKSDLSIDSVHLLKYKMNANGTEVTEVNRIRKASW